MKEEEDRVITLVIAIGKQTHREHTSYLPQKGHYFSQHTQ